MTDSIDPMRGFKPVPVKPGDELAPVRKSATTRGADRFSQGGVEPSGETYGPGLKAASPYQLLRNLVVKTLRDQGVNLQVADGTIEIDLTSISREEARELVSEDGYFGVEKTSQRIVDFAVNAFGNDPSRLAEMKAAIDKGFTAAQEAFVGALPEISQRTYDAIMEKLDAYAGQFEDVGE